MDKATFDKLVESSVASGATSADAALYIIRGYHIPVDENGDPIFISEQGAVGGEQFPPEAEQPQAPTLASPSDATPPQV